MFHYFRTNQRSAVYKNDPKARNAGGTEKNQAQGSILARHVVPREISIKCICQQSSSCLAYTIKFYSIKFATLCDVLGHYSLPHKRWANSQVPVNVFQYKLRKGFRSSESRFLGLSYMKLYCHNIIRCLVLFPWTPG